MEQYAQQYPGRKFVGFWRRYKTDEEYIHRGNPDSILAKLGEEELGNDIKDGLPWPQDYVDEEQNENLLGLTADYLEKGNPCEYYMGNSKCRLCNSRNGSADFTDGVYVWPEGLSHYVRDHKVRLPDEFIRHIIERLQSNSKLVEE